MLELCFSKNLKSLKHGSRVFHVGPQNFLVRVIVEIHVVLVEKKHVEMLVSFSRVNACFIGHGDSRAEVSGVGSGDTIDDLVVDEQIPNISETDSDYGE